MIASRRLSLLPIGRPAGALFGAVLMVVVGALTPKESYQAIDHDTLVLLFSMMILSVYFDRSGFFAYVTEKTASLCRTPWRLLVLLVLISGGLSAFFVNDIVCLFLTPVVIAVCRQAKLPFGPYLIALATSANIGSSATLVGNPQNMIIGSLSHFGFAAFIRYAGPAALIGLLINIGLLWLFYRRTIPAAFVRVQALPLALEGRQLLVLMVAVGIIIGFFAGFHLAYTALAGVLILIVFEKRDPRDVFMTVDWSLLIFFSCLFIVVAGLAKTGIVDLAWKAAASHLLLSDLKGAFLFTALMTAGSNLVSNVPMVLLTGPYLNTLGSEQMGWVMLSFSTTIAGNLTLVGSVANIIVAEGARNDYTLGFFEYLRFGFVSTIAVLTTGITMIYFMMC